MKYRSLILIIIASIFFLRVVAQNDVAGLAINGKTVGEITISESPAVLNVDQAKYKDITKAILNIKQGTIVSAYKRSILVTNENENELYTANESKSQPGNYNISISAIRQKALEQKILKVFLLEDPVNEKMSIPSRKKLIAELHLQ